MEIPIKELNNHSGLMPSGCVNGESNLWAVCIFDSPTVPGKIRKSVHLIYSDEVYNFIWNKFTIH